MLDAKPHKTPLPANFHPVSATDEEFAEARHEEYQAMVGSVMYAATISRPDIAFAANLLARHAELGQRYVGSGGDPQDLRGGE